MERLLLIFIFTLFYTSCEYDQVAQDSEYQDYEPVVRDLGQVDMRLTPTKRSRFRRNIKTGRITRAINEYVAPVTSDDCEDKKQIVETKPIAPPVKLEVKVITEEQPEPVLAPEPVEAELASADPVLRTPSSEISFEEITSEPPPTNMCKGQRSGYQLRNKSIRSPKGWTRSDWRNYCKGIDNIIAGKPVGCQVTHCTSASFFGILKKVRLRDDFNVQKTFVSRNGKRIRGSLKEMFQCKGSSSYGIAYDIYNAGYGLKNLMEKMQLGEYKQFSNMKRLEQNEKYFKRGEPVHIDRKNGSGHAVIFDRFKKSNGKITHICYWTSNSSTRGTGDKCESLGNRMKFLGVGNYDS